MARQGKGIFDSFSGNIGNIQGSKYGNLGVIKSKNTKSVKTQTQALTNTNNNFKLANKMYESFLAKNYGFDMSKGNGNLTFKNQFIGSCLKALSIKESGTYNINLIQPTYNFFKFGTQQLVFPDFITFVIDWYKRPFPSKSKSSDMLFRFEYNEASDKIFFMDLFSFWNREREPNQNSVSSIPSTTPRAFYWTFFVSLDRKEISNNILNLYVNPSI